MIGTVKNQYDIIGRDDTLATGDCQDTSAGGQRTEYRCKYTVSSSDAGKFWLQVGTGTKDKAGNAMTAPYIHKAETTDTAPLALMLDNTHPTVEQVVYATSATGSSVSRVLPPSTDTANDGQSIYVRVLFSEPVQESTGDSLPAIKYRAVYGDDTSMLSETQFTIADDGTVSHGECEETGTKAKGTDKREYTCLFDTNQLDSNTFFDTNGDIDITKSNAFRAYATGFKDSAGNAGTAQTYATALAGVTIAPETVVAADFLPRNGSVTSDAGTDITINFTGAVYQQTGTAGNYSYSKYTNSTIDGAIRLGTAPGLDNIGFAASIDGGADDVTIDPTADLSDGAVYMEMDNWYYGTNNPKLKGMKLKMMFTVDSTMPAITISEGNDSKRDKVIKKAVDDEAPGTSEMKYKLLPALGNCNAASMTTGTTDYTEATLLSFSDTSDNGKLLCFSSEDLNGNTGYKGVTLNIFDPLTATVTEPDSSAATTKTVSLSAVTGGTTVAYKQLTASACNASNYDAATGDGISVTLSDNSGSVIFSSETDNGKYVCFKLTKDNFIDRYAGTSAAIRGIDTTVPALVINPVSEGYVNGTEDSAPVAVSGTASAGATSVSLNITRGANSVAKNGIVVASEAWSTTITVADFVALGEGTVTISGTATDGANSGTATRRFIYDATRPTVSSAAYFSAYADGTRALSGSLSGTQNADTDIYTRVRFSEDVAHTAADDTTARPAISYAIGGTAYRYDIVGESDLLASGDCKPNHTLETDEYVCYYDVANTDNGAFTVKAGTDTEDLAGNAFASEYTNSTALTLNTDKPLISGIEYSTTAGGAAMTAIRPGSTVYATITFSEVVKRFNNNGVSARPSIKAKAMKGTTATIAEFQYDIVPDNADLRSEDCQETGTGADDGKVYTCRLTTSSLLTGTNVFKVFVTAFEDEGSNAGDAQTYATATASVNIEPTNTKPTISYALNDTTANTTTSLTDGMHTNESTADIVMTLTHPIYADNAGTKFTDQDDDSNTTPTDIANAVVLADATNRTVGSPVGGKVTIDYNTNGTVTITVDPTGDLSTTSDSYIGMKGVDGSDNSVWFYGDNATKMGGVAEGIFFTVDTTDPQTPITLALGEGLNPKDNDTTPDIVVTVNETGGTVTLYSDNSCATVASAATAVTDTETPYTVTVTASPISSDGDHVFHAIQTDKAGNESECSAGAGAVEYELDGTAPTVITNSTGYFSEPDHDLEDEMSGHYKSRDDSNNKVVIYTKVVFGEEVRIKKANNAHARPVINYVIAGVTEQYDMKGENSTLSSGDCKPVSTTIGTDAVTYTDSEFHCMYEIDDEDNGVFRVSVGTGTEDDGGNALASEYLHADTLTLDNTDPVVSSVSYWNSPSGGKKIGSAQPGTHIYSVVQFDAAVDYLKAADSTARPAIKSQAKKTGTATVSEFQYRIINANESLAHGRCRPNAAASAFTCMYTADRNLTGVNVFKTYATAFKDLAGNAGTGQDYDDVLTTVNITPDATEVPKVQFTPSDGAVTSNVSGNILVSFAAPVFAGTDGRKFSNLSIDDIITLNVNGSNVSVPGDNITVLNNTGNVVATIDPSSDFSNGDRVTVSVSDDWYYGVGIPKSKGTEAQAVFTVDSRKPVIESIGYADAESGGSSLNSVSAGGEIYTVFSFSEAVREVISDSKTARPNLAYRERTPILRDESGTVTLANSNWLPSGITADSSKLYVTDAFMGIVFVYNHDGTADSSFNLAAANSNAAGISVSGNTLYVADSSAGKVFGYLTDGSRSDSDDFDLASLNSDANGIAASDNRIYVADASDNGVYVYNMNGTAADDGYFDLAAGNDNPTGVTVTDKHVFVVNDGAKGRKIYAYNLDGSA